MIRWCAYCQRYQGDVEPLDDISVTHTICERCVEKGALLQSRPPSIKAIQAFLSRIARSGAEPGLTATEVVAQGDALGLDPVDLLLGVVQPVLCQIGDRWARSEATITEEHRVTALCSTVIQTMIARERDLAALQRDQPPAVLLVVADGNQHTLGVQIIEVFLLRHHVSTYAVYPSLPTQEIVALARSLQPRVVAISAALPEQLPSASAVAESLAGLPLSVRPVVAVGGRALDGDPPLPAGSPLVACKHLHTLLELASRPR
jgi:methanogenic corrinoid protein MtbC1